MKDDRAGAAATPPGPPVLVASVALDRAGQKVLDYEVPPELAESAAPGARVKVPLQRREVMGTVVDLRKATPTAALRRILEARGDSPMLSGRLLDLTRWVAEYYCCSLDAAVASVLPQAVRSGKVGAKKQMQAELLRLPAPGDLEKLSRRAPRQAEALRQLAKEGKAMPVEILSRQSGASPAALRALAAAGWLRLEARETPRDPHGQDIYLPTTDLPLNASQHAALQTILAAARDPATAKPILLHGVTGSGKTEVYLQAIGEILREGRQALVLVPEISLTPQTVERFKARFASIQREVAVLHSHLSAGERRDEWHKIHRGAARIVIGARSAVFAPLTRLGILIVDEEHETSYKQEDAPRYHARDVAVVRAKLESCAIVLGSATPSLESYANALSGKYQRVELPERVDSRKLPAFRVVDMRRERRAGREIFSEALALAMESRLARGEQVILFLNRRGYSTVVQCPACGSVVQCPNCSVALTYHREAERLACHICGHSQLVPHRCPSCSEPGIRHFGAGTQKVEETLRKFFPKARVARMDADAMSRKDAYKSTLGAFQRGQLDILVGTQMIAKGLDFPNVTLVGIVNADLSLHLPDFRAGERTFQLLTQVAGRAGRGEIEGEVIVQTFTPFSPSIQFARQHDFAGFAEQELEFREKFGFPPYRRAVLVTVRSPSEIKASFCAAAAAKKLREGLPEGAICGEAAPAPLARAKGYYRWQILLRGPASRALSRHVQHTLGALPMPEDVFITVDVDPVNLL